MPRIISANIRVRVPDHFVVGEGSIVDDYCYVSTRVEVGRHSHIAAGCHIAGGAARVVMIMPEGIDVKEHVISGDVSFGRCTAVGSNSVVMPNNDVPEGTAIGALSFVPARFAFEPWTVYAGSPIRAIRARNREKVLAQVERIEAHLQPRQTPVES